MDAQQLAAYLAHRMPDAGEIAVTNVGRIPGGASRETWSFDARWRDERGDTAEHGFIVRRDPTGSLLESNARLEFELYRALAGSGIPVPAALWLETDGAWLERPFFVMERLPGVSDGRTLASNPAWTELRATIARQKAEILSRIHRFDLGAISSLDRPGSPADAARHEIDRWERTMRQDMLEPQPVLELALSWLKRHLPPPPERLALVHADYRTGNFLYDERGITGILDWEMAHAGDPLEDLGWVVMKSWRWGSEHVGGLCPRDEFIRLYEAAHGCQVDREALRFWEVLGNVKFAVIFLTGTKAVVEGTTPDLLLALTAFINPGLEVELLELIT
ncbi:MAG TPA: phosphotransferase family protein [Dehalococcoidia bacterium]|nr:phosphotransferase family protein [Dehalococcoidia bacterium]